MSSAPAASPVTPEAAALLNLMYESLRKEIEQKLRSLDLLAIYAVIGTALTWSWMVTHRSELASSRAMIWLPLVTALLFAWKVRALKATINRASSHLGAIEQQFGLTAALGWELSCKAGRDARFPDSLARWDALFWIIICLINAAGPFLMHMAAWPW